MVMPNEARDPMPVDLGRRLVDTMHKLQTLRQALQQDEALGVMSQSGLTIAQMVALHVLARHGVRTVGGIASCVKLSPAATSHLVDRLVQRGLVARSEHTVDRRQKQVSISPAGRALVDRLDRAQLAGLTGLLAQLSPGMRQRLATVLSDLVAEIEPHLAALRAARAGDGASRAGARTARALAGRSRGPVRKTGHDAKHVRSRGQSEERA